MTARVQTRVALRPLDESDRARVRAWRNLPEVARYMYSDHEIGAEEHARWFAGALTDARRRYWIIEADGAPVGLANLYDIDAASRRCGWAYYLADPNTRGRGIGSFVEYAVLKHVFDEMDFNKLWCEVLASNTAVIALHEKVGFTREAHYRDHVLKAGAYEDVIGLAMRASDWRACAPPLRARLIEKGFAL